MSSVYTGRIIKLEIGTTSAINTDMTNVILMNWDRDHQVRPRLFANKKTPETYQQPHSWIVGSFSLLSDHYAALYNTAIDSSGNFALVPNADSNRIDFFQVTYLDENNNQVKTRFFFTILTKPIKEQLNHDDSVYIVQFLAGYAVDIQPGIIMSSKGDNDSIYVLNQLTPAVIDSFSGPGGGAKQGLAVDSSGNLLVSVQTDATIHVMDGITDTVSTSFSSPDSNPTGLAVDGSGNLISAGDTDNSIFIHVGVTSVVSTSFSSPDSGPKGLAVDSGGNLISVGNADQTVFIHVGITDTISTSFSTPSTFPTGAALEGEGNLLSEDTVTDTIYIHVGVTDTISTSFSTTPTSDGNPWGLAFG